MCILCNSGYLSSKIGWGEIEVLHIEDCSEIEDITELPPKLVELIAYGCSNLRRISVELPATLEELDVNDCSQLESLPPLAHTKLDTLDCAYTLVTDIPELPATLKRFGCGSPGLSVLPALPEGLGWFGIAHSPLLSALPMLPVGLQELEMDRTSIKELDLRPLAHLRRFRCTDNRFLLEVHDGRYLSETYMSGNTWLNHPTTSNAFRESLATLCKLQKRLRRVYATRRTALLQSQLLDRVAVRFGTPIALHKLLPFMLNATTAKGIQLRVQEDKPAAKRACLR